METSLIYVLARQLGIAAAAMCFVTNSAQPFGMLGSEQRATGEQALIRCVLTALVAWLEEQDGQLTRCQQAGRTLLIAGDLARRQR